MARTKRSKRAVTYSRKDVLEQRWDFHRALKELGQLLSGTHPEKNPIRQRDKALQIAKAMAYHTTVLSNLNRDFMSASLMEFENSGTAWTPEEDEALVQFRADGMEIAHISMELLRSPAAIATRLSVLVGIPRDQIVQGYLEGTLDGAEVSGQFEGTIK